MRYDLTARQKELLISARTQLLALISPDQGFMLATEFAQEVSDLVKEIERLLGY